MSGLERAGRAWSDGYMEKRKRTIHERGTLRS
jgi:hypothetical protein